MAKNALKGRGKSGPGPKIRALIAAVERGEGEAARDLGDRYREGDGVEKDLSASLHWYSVGAKLGNAHAQNNYGSMFFNGLGCTRDPQAAATWYRLSAEQGHRVAQFNLGVCYLTGDGVPRDVTQAAAWYEKAAQQGHLEALAQFGTMLRFGTGIEKNIVAAADFHTIAALDGDVSAIGNLAEYYEEIEKAGWQGNQTACLALAKMYDKGLGVEANRARTLSWLRWGRKQAVRQKGCDEELGEFLSFMELAAKIDDDVAAEAKKTYADWVKQYRGRPSRNRKRDG